ncbi:MAG: SDR family oxidoreductase [Deltaproteobacteria bacterium]|nr:SDR family oxidoreductase [Deltaproteobacteria bacterium]
MKLKDKVALVTGSGSGIGRAIAVAFAREGAKVAVNDIDDAKIEETLQLVKGAGVEGMGLNADVSSSSAVKAMFAKLLDRFGTIDVLVNNAGNTFGSTPRLEENVRTLLGQMMTQGYSTTSLEVTRYMPDEVWDKLIKIHVNGTFYCTREALAVMEEKRYGKIINMASAASIVGMFPASHYGAAKGAILGFTKSVAGEVVVLGINVNAIGPGFIQTPLLDCVSPEMMMLIMAKTPIGYLGTPEDIAPLAVYLASDESRYVVGQIISPNGGEVI